MPSGPLDLWMSKEDRARLTADWWNLTSGINLWHRGMVGGVIRSRGRGKESAQEIGFLFCRVDQDVISCCNGGSEGWLKLLSAAFESALN